MKRTTVILGIAAAMGAFAPIAAGSPDHAPGLALEWGTGAQPIYVASSSPIASQHRGSGPLFELQWGDGAPRSSSGSTRNDRAARTPFLVMGRAFEERRSALSVSLS